MIMLSLDSSRQKLKDDRNAKLLVKLTSRENHLLLSPTVVLAIVLEIDLVDQQGSTSQSSLGFRITLRWELNLKLVDSKHFVGETRPDFDNLAALRSLHAGISFRSVDVHGHSATALSTKIGAASAANRKVQLVLLGIILVLDPEGWIATVKAFDDRPNEIASVVFDRELLVAATLVWSCVAAQGTLKGSNQGSGIVLSMEQSHVEWMDRLKTSAAETIALFFNVELIVVWILQG